MSDAAERLHAAVRELLDSAQPSAPGSALYEVPAHLVAEVRERLDNRRVDHVALAECTHCGCVTIEPRSDNCACGCELYPVSKIVAPGTRIRNGEVVKENA